MSSIKNQLINQKSINQLIWASCGLNQSARSIIGHGGPRRASVLVLVGASLILPACGCEWPPNRPARPPHQLALSLFFFAASLEGRSDPAPEPYFSHMFGANFNWLNANCWREFSNGLSSAPPVDDGWSYRPPKPKYATGYTAAVGQRALRLFCDPVL